MMFNLNSACWSILSVHTAMNWMYGPIILYVATWMDRLPSHHRCCAQRWWEICVIYLLAVRNKYTQRKSETNTQTKLTLSFNCFQSDPIFRWHGFKSHATSLYRIHCVHTASTSMRISQIRENVIFQWIWCMGPKNGFPLPFAYYYIFDCIEISPFSKSQFHTIHMINGSPFWAYYTHPYIIRLASHNFPFIIKMTRSKDSKRDFRVRAHSKYRKWQNFTMRGGWIGPVCIARFELFWHMPQSILDWFWSMWHHARHNFCVNSPTTVGRKSVGNYIAKRWLWTIKLKLDHHFSLSPGQIEAFALNVKWTSMT